MTDTPHEPTRGTPPPDSPQAGIADAFSQLSEQTAALVRREIETARAEMLAKARQGIAAGALLGAAGVTGALATASLHTWVQRMLDKRLPPGWAALVAATLYGGAAGGLAVTGLERLREAPSPYPRQTLRQAAEDVREVRDSVSTQT